MATAPAIAQHAIEGRGTGTVVVPAQLQREGWLLVPHLGAPDLEQRPPVERHVTPWNMFRHSIREHDMRRAARR